MAIKKKLKMNKYGDPIGTRYGGGTPLFNESTGETITLEEYKAGKTRPLPSKRRRPIPQFPTPSPQEKFSLPPAAMLAEPTGLQQISPNLGVAQVPQVPQVDPATGQPIVQPQPIQGQPIPPQPLGANPINSKISSLYAPLQPIEQMSMRRIFRILPIKKRKNFAA